MSDLQKILVEAERLAPFHESLAALGRAVNGSLGIDMSEATWRGIWKRNPKERDLCQQNLASAEVLIVEPNVSIEGAPAFIEPDVESIRQRMADAFSRADKLATLKRNQHIRFDHGPIALVGLADTHFGGDGTDIGRAYEEVEIVVNTPGMYAFVLGDITDNFLGNLSWMNAFQGFTLEDQAAIALDWLTMLAPKTLAVVGGNHDLWTRRHTGIDYFRKMVATVRPGVLYDPYEILVTAHVGKMEVPIKIRHKWRGTSINNPTSGIERAMRFDQDFLVGFGAHTHVSGLTRGINVGGRSGMALLAGAYKRHDDYAREGGFTRPNDSTAVTLIIDNQYESLTGFENLHAAADYMRTTYRGK